MITDEDMEDAESLYNLCVQIETGLLVYDDLPKMVSRIRAEAAEQSTKKARELIKEMREQLSAVVSTESTPTTKGELVYVNNYIEMRELLERTKEYAE